MRSALRKHGVTAPIDAHLMVKPVDRIIPDFAKAGASYITFHPEARADTFVAGSAIFNSGDYVKTIAAMRAELTKTRK